MMTGEAMPPLTARHWHLGASVEMSASKQHLDVLSQCMQALLVLTIPPVHAGHSGLDSFSPEQTQVPFHTLLLHINQKRHAAMKLYEQTGLVTAYVILHC